MQRIFKFWKKGRGFTLLEMTAVTAIIAVTATIVTGTVTNQVGNSRASTKAQDISGVQSAVQRYEADNPSTFPVSFYSGTSNPTKTIVGIGQATSGTTKIKVDTTATDTGTTAGVTADVTCGSSSSTLAEALAQCFAPINFNSLVPTYLTNKPKHGGDAIASTISASVSDAIADIGTSDDIFTDATLSQDDIQLFLDTQIPTTALNVWNVDKNNSVVVFKTNANYGKSTGN